MSLNSIIIDDEAYGRANLVLLIKKYCPQINIIGEAGSAKKAVKIIKKRSPDILFLDIQMPETDGFQLLELLENRPIFIIFVTAYAKYAYKAIKYSALDYLLKPVNPRELIEAVKKVQNRHRLLINSNAYQKDYKESVQKMISANESENSPKTLTLNVRDGIQVFEIKNIIRLEANSSYTDFYSINKKKVISSKPLKYYTEFLDDEIFVRTHKSHFVNKSFIEKYIKTPESHIVLKNGQTIPIARRRLTYVLNRLEL